LVFDAMMFLDFDAMSGKAIKGVVTKMPFVQG
jgi:hypothetical protein